MAVISDYEEEEPMQTSTPRQPAPPEPVKPPQEARSEPPPQAAATPPPPQAAVTPPPPQAAATRPPPQSAATPPPVEQPRAPTPPPASSPPQADNKAYQHDPVLSALLEEHKRQPLELLTTVIDFLFRETDLSREARVENRVTEIVTAAKRRRSAYDGEDAAPEKIAKVDEAKSPQKETPPVKVAEPKTVKPKTPRNETAQSSNVTPSPASKEKDSTEVDSTEVDSTDIDTEGTGLTPNIGNGYDHETYCWTQTLGEATIHIKMPEGTKAKALVCEIKGKTLKAGLKGQELILQGEFYTPVKADDCVWSLEEDGTLSIYVTKCNKMGWWKSVLKGEPEINTRKVMPENSRLDELDLETRSTAEKLMVQSYTVVINNYSFGVLDVMKAVDGKLFTMKSSSFLTTLKNATPISKFLYDQRQKALGLPTSDESSKSDAIKKFMEQHPEMDFSKAKIC